MNKQVEKKFIIPGDLLSAIALFLQKKPWEEVNMLLVGIQQQVNELVPLEEDPNGLAVDAWKLKKPAEESKAEEAK